MSFLECFWFPFCQGHIVNKSRHYSAEFTALYIFLQHYSTRDCVVHILDNFVSEKLSILIIVHEFGHSPIN